MNVILTSKDASARVRRWQRGGTVTGVIVGLIVGLTVAVWVAMTILKTPLPFVDKISKQTQPAGELGDPNKTMPGGARERRERISDDEPKVPGSVPATPPPPAAAKSAKAEMAPALAVPASSPATEKSRLEKSPASTNAASQASTPAPATNPTNTVTPATAPPAAPSTTAAPQPEGFTYYLQAGAFREINDAEATKAKLALMGVAATIAERKSELGTLYRVRVGPFSEIEAMNRARLRLSDNGVDAAVVKVPK
jgi:cell division protein FtsN